MRLRIGRDTLADAVAWAARALPSRPVIPILAGLLLDAGQDGGLVLSCFDYEVSARVNAVADVAEPGRALVSGRLLAEIARSLPSRPVDLATETDNLVLTCGSARFTLLTLPTEDYPALPDLPPAAGRLDGGEFATAVSQVAVAAGRDDTLPMLTGVLMEADGPGITLVATDRYRMALRELGWQPTRPDLRATALVPARTLVEAARTMTGGSEITIALTGQDVDGKATESAVTGAAEGSGGHGYGGTVGGYGAAEGSRGHGYGGATAGYGGGYAGGGARGHGGVDAADGLIGFAHDDRRFTTRLLGTEFITYRSRFPREFTSRAEVAGAAFADAIRRVALVADRESRLLLTFAAGSVVIETGSGEGSRAVETVDAIFEGEDGFTIAFKPQYLLDGIVAAGARSPGAVGAGRADRVSGGGQHSSGTRTAAEPGARSPDSSGPDVADPDADATVGDRETADVAGTQAAEPGGRVTLAFTGPEKPAVITGGPGFRYLLAPMRS